MGNTEATKEIQAAEEVKMPITYEDLKKQMVDSGRPYDFEMIDRAYALAEQAHGGQRRRSGEPYICHPLSVAQILVELGMDSESIAALYEKMTSLYRLDQIQSGNGKAELGPLPAESRALLWALGLCWAGILTYLGLDYRKKKRKSRETH